MKKLIIVLLLIYSFVGIYSQVIRANPFYVPSSSTTVVYTDNFDSYAHNSILGGQGSWLAEKGVWRAYKPSGTDGSAFPNTSSAYGALYVNIAVDGDQWAEIEVISVTVGNGVGVAVRCQGGTGYFYVWCTTSTAARLMRVDNAGTTTIDTSCDPFVAGDIIRLEISGYTLSCYRNGELDTSVGTGGQYTDTSAGKLSGGYVGMGSVGSTTSSTADNFRGGSL